MSFQLFEHQNIALPILKRMENDGKGGFLADEMGLGKTILMSTHLMQNKIPNKSDLIVCPISLLKQWNRELKRVYKGFNKKKPSILLYHGKNRDVKLKSKNWDYILTTYSILGNQEFGKAKWGRVILDESHYIKNGLKTKKVKCAEGAFAISKRSKFNWCITGTPFCNRMKDIASQCKFIGTKPYSDPEWWKKNENDSELMGEWRDKFVLRRTKDNLLAAPIYHDIEINPTQQESVLIDQLRDKAKNKFECWKRSKGLSRITLQGEILGLIQRLRIVSDSYYCGEKKISVQKVMKECAKVNTMVELLDRKLWEDPSNSIVVFSQFTSYLDVLGKIIEKNMVGVDVMKFTGSMNSTERDDVIDEFTASTNPRILLVSLLAGGCGLNLIPCSTVFLSEPYYNPFMEKQAEERVHRLGQQNQVNVYRFSMKNSVETWINGLKKKKLFFASSLDFCRGVDVPSEFSFDDLPDLFTDLVGFKKNDKNDKTKEVDELYEEPIPPDAPEQDIFGIECSICLDDVGSRAACNLVCGHLFHNDCINYWRNANDTCPMCRSRIDVF
jgi:transcription termination factor 2